MALPRLKAPILTAETRFGASDAASITRIWSGGTMAKVATPHRKIVTAAARGEYIVIANSRSIAASPASETISVRSIERSEEHTSEPQSLMRQSYAVFCLKKKQITHTLSSHIRYANICYSPSIDCFV